MDFKEMHNQTEPLLIANVWDITSAKTAYELGYKSIGTSSAAISKLFGKEDGEQLSFAELKFIVKQILSECSLPFSVDLEAGYGQNPEIIAENIFELINLGVAGINIEDSVVIGERKILNAEDFAGKLTNIINRIDIRKSDIFINVRTDTFLLGLDNAMEETIRRIRMYENAGADGIFVPCIVNEEDIKSVVNCTRLPVNVMCMPNLPNFETLKKLGVKRISMGNFVFENMLNHFKLKMSEIQTQRSFKTIF